MPWFSLSSFGRRRHNHERVDTEDVDVDIEATTPGGGVDQGSSPTSNNNNNNAAGLEEQQGQDNNNNNNNNDLVLPFATDDDHVNNNTNTNMPSLADLQEEREVVRRRTSLCVLLAVFVLFRLWVQALTTGDFGLLVLSMMGTHFCARFIRLTREREEALDRLIQEYNTANATTNTNNDLRGMSFQSQLALAILESHRQMVQGGGFGTDGNNNNNGVSEQAKQQWKYFAYQNDNEEDDNLKYTKDDFNDNDNDNHVHCCSICLGDYEVDEALVALPCHHVYHDECISSWCANHTRCPLCNFHLMEGQRTDLRPFAEDIHDID